MITNIITDEEPLQASCPNNDNGYHRYFMNKTVVEFIPFKIAETMIDTLLYEKVEYAISGCNCGAAIKERIQQGRQ